MLTPTDWIAVASVALPQIVRVFSDWQANAIANHNAALARIIGMAGREAATIAKTIEDAPPGMDLSALKTSLISTSGQAILDEMGSSAGKVGADLGKLFTIVRGELNKIETSKKVT